MAYVIELAVKGQGRLVLMIRTVSDNVVWCFILRLFPAQNHKVEKRILSG